MAQERGAAGSGDHEPKAAGSEVPDTPDMYGDNGLVGEGRYRLTYRLGRGGMAEVFAAEDVRLGRPVAVKLLRADLAEDPTSKARFTREAQSVAGLNHHAVVAVYDSGEETMRLGTTRATTVPYMVMELVHGRTIRELLINAEAPPVQQALIIVSGVLEALGYSHQHGIVHRDIKPANVIITDTGTVKVMDFGIARALHGAAQTMTQTGMVMGTPQYLSPEQALGKTVDIRSDLYAVGCLLYELLALRPPFVGETPLSVVYQHVQDIARPPSEVATTAPPELDGLVMRALAKDPEERFQSAEEMRGMVAYALRMLEEHGTHTGGLWNTGSVSTGLTPPMGTPLRAPTGATARVPGGTAATGQLASPMLLGQPGDGDDGGRGGRSGGGNGRRGRLVLVALLAVIAIGTGVLVAANLGNDTAGDGNGTQSDTEDSGDTGGDQTRDDQTGDPGADENVDEGATEDDYIPTDPTTPTMTETETETETSPTESETDTPTESETETTPPDDDESETETTPPDDDESETETTPPDETEPEPDPTDEEEDEGTTGGTLP